MFSTLLDSPWVVWSPHTLCSTCYKLSPVVQRIFFYLFFSPHTILQLATLALYGRKAVSPQLQSATNILWHFLDCNLKLHASLNTVLLLIQATHFSTKAFIVGFMQWLLYKNPTLKNDLRHLKYIEMEQKMEW